MTRHKRDSRRRGQPSPDAPVGLVSHAPGYTWYDPDEGKLHGERRSSFKARWVTHEEAVRLKRNRDRTRKIQRGNWRKPRKRRRTPKGEAFNELTKLVYKLCTLLRAPLRRGGVAPVYHEPEESIQFFWRTIDAMMYGKHVWSHWDVSKIGTGYNHVRTLRWSKVEHNIEEIEAIIWSWGLHWKYGVWRLWLNEGERIKAVIGKVDSREWHERIQVLIDNLPPTQNVSDEYKYMPLTEPSK